MNYKPLTDVRYLVVHCAATPPDMDVGAKEIDLWHRQRGFLKIGYHAVIRRDGTIESGRPLDQPGAHVARFNDRSLGVCLVGGCKRVTVDGKKVLATENNFTPQQFTALTGLLKQWHAKYPLARIVGHRDLDSGKDCPSFDVSDWLATVNLTS